MNSWALKQITSALAQDSWQESRRDGSSLLLPNMFADLIIRGITTLFLVSEPALYAMPGISPHQHSSMGAFSEEWHMAVYISHPWVRSHHFYHKIFLPNARGLNWPQRHLTDSHEVQLAGINHWFLKVWIWQKYKGIKNFSFFAASIHFRSFFFFNSWWLSFYILAQFRI